MGVAIKVDDGEEIQFFLKNHYHYHYYHYHYYPYVVCGWVHFFFLRGKLVFGRNDLRETSRAAIKSSRILADG